MLSYENIVVVSAIIVVLMSIINLYTSRESEEGTQASAEERFQGQEEEEVEQTNKTISMEIILFLKTTTRFKGF